MKKAPVLIEDKQKLLTLLLERLSRNYIMIFGDPIAVDIVNEAIYNGYPPDYSQMYQVKEKMTFFICKDTTLLRTIFHKKEQTKNSFIISWIVEDVGTGAAIIQIETDDKHTNEYSVNKFVEKIVEMIYDGAMPFQENTY